MQVQHGVVGLDDDRLHACQAIQRLLERLAVPLLYQGQKRKTVLDSPVDRDQLHPGQFAGEDRVFADSTAEVILRGHRQQRLAPRRSYRQEPAEVAIAQTLELARDLLDGGTLSGQQRLGVVKPCKGADFVREAVRLERGVRPPGVPFPWPGAAPSDRR